MSATLLSSNALKWWPCPSQPQPQAPSIFRSALFLKNEIRLYRKMLLWRNFGGKYRHKPPKMCMTIIHLVANKGLIWPVITTSRINLFAWTIFLYGKRCNMYRVYCLNYIWTNVKWNWKTKFFLIGYWQHNIFLNKRIWIIRCFQTHCLLSKFIIRDMLFKTKFIAMPEG